MGASSATRPPGGNGPGVILGSPAAGTPCVLEAHWLVARRRLGRPARPQGNVRVFYEAGLYLGYSLSTHLQYVLPKKLASGKVPGRGCVGAPRPEPLGSTLSYEIIVKKSS
jgi:hypothetical protein